MTFKIEDFPNHVQQQIRNRLAASSANVEQNTPNAPVAKDGAPRISTLCRVHFHSIRGRLADADGISGKAVLDGLVYERILGSDTTEKVSATTHSQEKGKPEKTIITIYY